MVTRYFFAPGWYWRFFAAGLKAASPLAGVPTSAPANAIETQKFWALEPMF
jgi:hypothetical protein